MMVVAMLIYFDGHLASTNLDLMIDIAESKGPRSGEDLLYDGESFWISLLMQTFYIGRTALAVDSMSTVRVRTIFKT